MSGESEPRSLCHIHFVRIEEPKSLDNRVHGRLGAHYHPVLTREYSLLATQPLARENGRFGESASVHPPNFARLLRPLSILLWYLLDYWASASYFPDEEFWLLSKVRDNSLSLCLLHAASGPQVANLLCGSLWHSLDSFTACTPEVGHNFCAALGAVWSPTSVSCLYKPGSSKRDW